MTALERQLRFETVRCVNRLDYQQRGTILASAFSYHRIWRAVVFAWTIKFLPPEDGAELNLSRKHEADRQVRCCVKLNLNIRMFPRRLIDQVVNTLFVKSPVQ